MATVDGGLISNGVTRAIVRHLLATLAYRAAKVLRDVPADFAHRDCGASTRRPVQIVAHMGDLMTWALSITRGEPAWSADGGEVWNLEVDRFFACTAALDQALCADVPDGVLATLIQGPLADALTHVGQLALLRGMAGIPVRPESYARAAIAVGTVGPEQPPPGREFDGDASARSRT